MTRLRIVIITLAAAAGLAALAGAAVVFLGLYNTSARSGHWAITGWVLHTAFENAVELRAPGPEAVPEDLEDPALIELGARHFDSACRMCHASPGQVADATIAAMVPPPPQVEEAVVHWQPAELHWIVRQGVKMSGMPAWPAEGRGDEVWAVVAFLSAVKRGMSDEEYEALTAPAPQGYCAGCHGSQGTVRAPRLDILSPEYIATALRAYRTGARPSGIMSHAISQMDPEADARLAAELLALSPPTRDRNNQAPVGDADALAWSGAIDIPACLSCHGPRNANPLIPSLDGQRQAYLEQQLFLWRDGERGGGSRAVLMHSAAQSLSDQQIASLAGYFAAREAPRQTDPQ